ncbi:diacylglycerol kinase family protein [Streptomyces sp. NPDC051452]|uniref:diacylglycerol kinase family protein n=1 Tax=Streptomyces sp. NPDC051452 TaxID=3365654 RepID=UPI0037BBDDCE
MAAESGLPFVVVPAGTRNHFAMDLGLNREDPSAAVEALTDGVELRVDLGYAGDRAFVDNDKIGTMVRILPEFLGRHEGPDCSRWTGRVDDPAGLGGRAQLDSGLLGALAARAETPAEAAARLRSGQTHGLTGLATPDDVVIHADAPAAPSGSTAKPSPCPLPYGAGSVPGRYGYGPPSPMAVTPTDPDAAQRFQGGQC